MKINYENLSDWLSLHKVTWGDLADIAGVQGAAISNRKRAGRPMRVEWMLAWRKEYDWSYDLMCHLCMDGPLPKQPVTKQYIAIDVEDLQRLITERTSA